VSGLHSVDTLSMYLSSLGITRRKQKKVQLVRLSKTSKTNEITAMASLDEFR